MRQMTNALLRALAVVMLAGLALPPAHASAATIEIFPSNADASCNEEFENRANALKPGDVLILHGGTHPQTCRRGNTDSYIIRGNHIHHTGLLASSVGTTEGEGMYVGCNNATCVASNHLIEGNYIHHTRGTSAGGNDGIEVKAGSYGNIIRNNVIHDTNIGMRDSGIFRYGGGNAPN